MNVISPISATESGMTTDWSEVQFSKAHHPISVTESGMLTVCREVQPLKAPFPIFFTVLGMSMACRVVQHLNALPPISATELGIEYDFILFPVGKCNITDLFLLNKMPSDEEKSSLSSSTFIACSDLHPLNALSSIFVTEMGILMLSKEVQSEKISCSITVTDLGMSKDCRDAQPLKASFPITATE